MGTRRIHLGSPGSGCGPRGLLNLAPTSVRTTINTGWARSRSDEGAWGTRGSSLEVRAGIHGGWGPVEYAFVPSLHLEENRAFEIPRQPLRSEFQYPWQGTWLDWALRPGEGTESRILSGPSHLSLTGGRIRVGASTQPLWWGPSVRNPILLSGTAAGFRHLYLQSRRPLRTPVGAFDFEFIFGRLSPSEFLHEFEEISLRRGLAGLFLAFDPALPGGLELGLALLNHARLTDDMGPLDQFREVLSLFREPFAEDLTDNIPGNALAAVYFRWRFPESGLEFYGELGRNDHAADFADLMGEPDHSIAFVAGIQKVFQREENRIRLLGEITDLRDRIPLGPRFPPLVFYRHHQVREGHTHQGQLLGAPIGPGALAVHLGGDLLSPEHGLIGLYLERVEYDASAHRLRFAPTWGTQGRDREWTLGARHHRVMESLGPLQGVGLSAEAAYSRRVNRLFLGLVNGDGLSLPVERNWHLDLRLTWHPPLFPQ
jgi:hypothetical protein